MSRWRKPIGGRHGKWLIVGGCAYELLSLLAEDPRVPPFTELNRRNRLVGLGLLAALGHHFYIEQVVQDFVDDLAALSTGQAPE